MKLWDLQHRSEEEDVGIVKIRIKYVPIAIEQDTM